MGAKSICDAYTYLKNINAATNSTATNASCSDFLSSEILTSMQIMSCSWVSIKFKKIT